MWRLNNTLPNNTWIKEDILREILKYFGLKKKKENTTYRNLWDAVKAVLRGKLTALMYYKGSEI